MWEYLMTNTVYFREPDLSLEGEWNFWIESTINTEKEISAPIDEGTASTTVTLPHAWQECSHLREYTGRGWYQRKFEYDACDPNTLVRLVFDAVDFETSVWINGKKVGINQQGYLPFDFDITNIIKSGENTITLQVEDPEETSELPHGKQGNPWYTRVSGPWQPIKLITLPDLFVQSIQVTPDIETDTATFEVTIEGERTAFFDTTADYTLTISVSNKGDHVISDTFQLTGPTLTATIDIPDPEYWCPDNPTLYDFEVLIQQGDDTVDIYEDYFGMRSISCEDDGIYLNGERLYIRGALDQGYYPDTIYRPADIGTFEREIYLAKEMGFNLLRKHIKPAHPRFIEAADRLGILVWEEPANPKRYTKSSKERMIEQLERLIQRDYNSPSVVIWSLYNEEWGIGSADDEVSLWEDEQKQQYLKHLYEQVRELDPTRLICDNSGWAHVATDINDYHEYFVAPDRVAAWRDRLDAIVNNPASNYSDAQTDPEASPIIISEFGTWGLSKISRLYDHYNGDPPWFEHSFLSGLKDPKGVRNRFRNSYASNVFNSLDEMAVAWQNRQFQSLRTVIADIRTQDDISGYVITELSDIEWEFNGILNYLREKKSFTEDLQRLNSPVMIELDPSSKVAWSCETVTAGVKIANDTSSTIEREITVRAAGQTNTHTVKVDSTESVTLSDGLSFDVPSVEEISTIKIEASTAGSARSLTHEIYAAPRGRPTEAATIWTPHSELCASMRSRGHSIATDRATADVAVVSDPTNADIPIIVVPYSDGSPPDPRWFSYEALPKRESWNLCASFVYQTELSNIDAVPGWAFGGVYPHCYITDIQPDDDVLIGYTEGWLKNSGGFAVVREAESGSLGACTLPVIDSYGDHPILTVFFDRMIEQIV